MSKHAQFNRDEVIVKATNLYWEKGFTGTSMRNLQDVIDMRPGSIYAAFGSKENLFKETLLYYASGFDIQFKQCLSETPTIIEALKRFIKSAVVDQSGNAPSAMCMLVKTIAELTDQQHELVTQAKQLLSSFESKLSKIIAKAITLGELDNNKNPEKLARYLQVQIIGLRTYARANDNREAVFELVDEMFTDGPFANK